jgi:hypothetical protein
MRLIYAIGLIALLAVVVVLVHLQFGGPPDARLGGCDPNDMAGSQALELARLSDWLLWRQLLGAFLVAGTAYSLLYFQVFHRLAVPIAWLGRAAIIAALAVAVGMSIKWLAQSWVANSSGTCLSEAIQTNPTGLSIAGRVVPGSWPWAISVDAVALALVGAALGLLAYSIARQARA